jgi:hypothetical protein
MFVSRCDARGGFGCSFGPLGERAWMSRFGIAKMRDLGDVSVMVQWMQHRDELQGQQIMETPRSKLQTGVECSIVAGWKGKQLQMLCGSSRV